MVEVRGTKGGTEGAEGRDSSYVHWEAASQVRFRRNSAATSRRQLDDLSKWRLDVVKVSMTKALNSLFSFIIASEI